MLPLTASYFPENIFKTFLCSFVTDATLPLIYLFV